MSGGVHGVGGMLGTILLGVFATTAVNGSRGLTVCFLVAEGFFTQTNAGGFGCRVPMLSSLVILR